ncbi:MAG: hypothetical protein ACI9G1_004803 [Pirellulaceae bacterium]
MQDNGNIKMSSQPPIRRQPSPDDSTPVDASEISYDAEVISSPAIGDVAADSTDDASSSKAEEEIQFVGDVTETEQGANTEPDSEATTIEPQSNDPQPIDAQSESASSVSAKQTAPPIRPEPVWEMDEETNPPDSDLPPVRIVEAEFVREATETRGRSSLPFWLLGTIAAGFEYLFGLAGLVAGLAVLATIPILNLLSLGYLLEASGRVAESGKLRDGFIGIRKSAQLTSLVAGTWLTLLIPRFAADLWYSAHLINEGSAIAGRARIGLLVATAASILHIIIAWFCGGKLRHFFWPLLAIPMLALWCARKILYFGSQILRPLIPSFLRSFVADVCYARPLTDWFPPAIILAGIRRGRMYRESRDAVWKYLEEMQVWYFFWMGARGFAGAFILLFPPVALLVGVTLFPPGPAVLAGIIGFPLMAAVVLYLPFLQTHFACENRFWAMFELRKVRENFCKAPIAFWFSLFITLLFALPLYLLKIELTPREVAFIPSIVFIAFIFPARLLAGWAYGRARNRKEPRFFLSRWGARLATLPVVGAFVFIVYFTKYISWNGAWSLFEQHAFLVPVPFLGM